MVYILERKKFTLIVISSINDSALADSPGHNNNMFIDLFNYSSNASGIAMASDFYFHLKFL